MKPVTLRLRYWPLIAAAVLFISASLLADQTGVSHARVVRLSYISGTVAVKRPGTNEWAKAMVNTPIQEGFSLSTSAGSYAEVEFENGTAAQLGELSQLDFVQLALGSRGEKLNRLRFAQGYATFHLIPEHGDEYTVEAGGATLSPSAKNEFRTNLDQNQLTVEVFKGWVKVETPNDSVKLGKDKVLEYNAQTDQAFNIRSGIQKDAWDRWAEARDRQSLLARKDSAVPGPGSLYGWSDLDAYGEWLYMPGYGYGWSPYAPVGWMPYSMGMWDWYPSFGWTWISADPWGWLPYHYGLWNFDPMFGWFWMPTGFSVWSPALVSWYTGPGWIGWVPFGAAGTCNCVATVANGVMQSGTPILPRTVVRGQPGQGTLVSRPPFEPSQVAMRHGMALAPGTPLPGSREIASSPASRSFSGPSSTRPSAPAAMNRRVFSAPSEVLMGEGGAKAPASSSGMREDSFRGKQPLRARLGNTLGGKFPVAGNARGSVLRGESERPGGPVFARSAPRASERGMERSAQPQILPHGNAGGAARSSAGMEERSGGFGGGMRGGGESMGTAGGMSRGGGGRTEGGRSEGHR